MKYFIVAVVVLVALQCWPHAGNYLVIILTRMKNKFIVYAVVPVVLSVGLIGANAAVAHGMFGAASNLSPEQIVSFQQNIFTKEAQILGISEAELKADWALGKTFNQIIQDRKLDKAQIEQRGQVAQVAQMKTQLQTLVEKGVITQAQADSRLAAMQTKMSAVKGKKGHGRMGQMGGIGGAFGF